MSSEEFAALLRIVGADPETDPSTCTFYGRKIEVQQ